jgi:hypothetical protein
VLIAAGATPFGGQTLVVRAPGNYVIGGLRMVCFLVGIGLAVQEHLAPQQLWPPGLKRSRLGLPLIATAYPPGQAFRFYDDIRALVSKADEVRLISMGLQILWVGNMLEVLFDRVRSGAKVTACMANPYNAAVLHRLIEEEMSDLPPQFRRKGIEGNIQTLVTRLSREGDPDGFRFCLFEHYPTFATYIVDKDVFVAPYTYQRLGSDAPVLHLRDDGNDRVARFVIENAERTLRDAVPAQEVLQARRNRRHFSAEWTAACIAIVPNADETLYRFGSSVVGFDLWAGASEGVQAAHESRERRGAGDASVVQRRPEVPELLESVGRERWNRPVGKSVSEDPPAQLGVVPGVGLPQFVHFAGLDQPAEAPSPSRACGSGPDHQPARIPRANARPTFAGEGPPRGRAGGDRSRRPPQPRDRIRRRRRRAAGTGPAPAQTAAPCSSPGWCGSIGVVTPADRSS